MVPRSLLLLMPNSPDTKQMLMSLRQRKISVAERQDSAAVGLTGPRGKDGWFDLLGIATVHGPLDSNRRSNLCRLPNMYGACLVT